MKRDNKSADAKEASFGGVKSTGKQDLIMDLCQTTSCHLSSQIWMRRILRACSGMVDRQNV
jgi:hypothetical protein